MKATSLKRAIESRGGSAEIVVSYPFPEHTTTAKIELVGELAGYDLHMHGDHSDFYTGRRQSKRGEYDPGSDYNPGGYTFLNRLKDLDWLVKP